MNMEPKYPLKTTAPPDLLRYVAPEDEISLVDLWLVIQKHRRLIALIAGIIFILGGVFAVFKQVSYSYTTTIQIAHGDDGLLEQPVTLLAKLTESYIPYVLQEHVQSDPHAKKIKVTAEIPKDSNIIVMRSEGMLDDQELHFALHAQILNKLAKDHDPEIDVVKLTMENDMNRIRNQLDKLRDEAASLQTQGKRLDEQERLLKDQLKDLQKLIDTSEENRNKALREVQGEAKAMTLMLIDNETKKYQDREADIKERLLLGVPTERDGLKNSLADNLRKQTELQEKLQQLQAKIVNIRYTRPIVPTLRSLDAHGTGRSVIIALAAVLGLMLGIFAAFLAEFRLKVQKRLTQLSVGESARQRPAAG